MAFAVCCCRNEVKPEPRPVDLLLEKIEGTWNISTVVLSGVRKVDDETFTITFSGNESDELVHFSCSNLPAHSPWPASGTLKVVADRKTTLIMMPDSEAETEIDYSADDSMLEFTILDITPKPQQDGEIFVPITGSWVFTFTR